MIRADKTTQQLLNAAEAQLKRRGIEEVSLRDITRAAGVNVAAANYHFGSKAGLLLAVFKRYVEPIHEERLRRLSALEQACGSNSVPLEAIARALLEPVFDSLEKLGDLAPVFLHLGAKLLQEPESKRGLEGEPGLLLVLRRFDRALARTNPGISADERWRRLLFVVGILFSISFINPLLRRFAAELDVNAPFIDIRESLIQFAIAGFSAPMPELQDSRSQRPTPHSRKGREQKTTTSRESKED